MDERTKTMRELVLQEADNLKKHATKEELEKLNILNLQNDHSENCIYGQMTGHCFEERAHELIMLCAPKVYNVIGQRDWLRDGNELNGPPTKINGRLRGDVYYSPIEIFISQGTNKVLGNNKRLIDYLKGNVKELIFE